MLCFKKKWMLSSSKNIININIDSFNELYEIYCTSTKFVDSKIFVRFLSLLVPIVTFLSKKLSKPAAKPRKQCRKRDISSYSFRRPPCLFISSLRTGTSAKWRRTLNRRALMSGNSVLNRAGYTYVRRKFEFVRDNIVRIIRDNSIDDRSLITCQQPLFGI